MKTEGQLSLVHTVSQRSNKTTFCDFENFVGVHVGLCVNAKHEIQIFDFKSLE
jgi:hypothetical protein